LCGARSAERQRQAAQHHRIDVKPDVLNASNAKERKAIVMLQASKLALDG
jgi:hypothetical protein